MRRLTQAPNIAIASLWADTLCQAGIEASVQRQFLSSVAGEVPPDQCLPEIWIMDDEPLEPARACLRQLQTLPQRRWRSARCSCRRRSRKAC